MTEKNSENQEAKITTEETKTKEEIVTENTKNTETIEITPEKTEEKTKPENTSKEEEREKNAEKEFKKLMSEINNLNSNPMTSQAQLKRLLSSTFVNPYDILMLSPDATEEEIKKQYKTISLLVHPDKCAGEPRAADAFHSKIRLK
jgi:hypothetical protein